MKLTFFKSFLTAGLLLAQSVAFATVDIQTWKTAKGTKVMYVHAPELPMVDIEVLFDAGSARDGEQWGIASFTSAMIGTATPRKDEETISQGFNELGVQLGGSAGRDSANLYLRSLTRDEILNPALDLLTEVLTQPVFKQDIMERKRSRLLIGLKQKTVKPRSIGSEALWATLYGDHPYAHPKSGTIETVKTFTTKDLLDFYNQYYVAANAQISIVGAVDRKQAEQIAEKLVKQLPTGKKPAPLPQPTPLKEAKKIVKPFNSTQTYYTLSQLGIQRGNPDYYALFLGNHLLGGSGFGSLLMEEVREERGLVYSVSSYFAPMKVPGPFMVRLSTKNATANEADKVVRETLVNFMKDFPEEKLEAIKSNLINGFPLRLSSNGKLMGYISMIGQYNLPLTYLDEFPKIIAKLEKQDVLDAWNRTVHPDKMLTVMVGKPE